MHSPCSSLGLFRMFHTVKAVFGLQAITQSILNWVLAVIRCYAREGFIIVAFAALFVGFSRMFSTVQASPTGEPSCIRS